MKKVFSRLHKALVARPRLDWMFVGLFLAIFVGLAFWNITAGSIWFDEAFSAYLIQYNFLDIARYTATDVHPPFYYWLLQLWSFIFGDTEIGLRSMSVFFGVVAAIFAYLWVKRHFGRRAALIALALLVLSPLFIRYSQEARMYTLAAAIIFAATYVLSRAEASGKRSTWVGYGVLVSLGMWTHYFTALAWIAHWVWRFVTIRQKGLRGKELAGKFFDRNWLTAYIVAVGLFLPWLPAMAVQLAIIQTQGFWIGPVGLDTVGSYIGTLVFFLQSFQVTSWMALGVLAIGAIVVVTALRVYKKGTAPFKRAYLLITIMALLPPALLFVLSMPPLTPSFVERYLLPAAIASTLLVGVTLSVGLRGRKLWQQVAVYAVIIVMLVGGIGNMYFYNNYNKNSQTGIETERLVQLAMERSEPGQPIIANSPWVFYEASFYATDRNPIYFIDEDVEYIYGSLDMLKYDDRFKIKDLDAFLAENPVVWYIGYAENEIEPPRANLTPIDSVGVTNKVDGKTVYKGVEYRTQP